MGSADSVPAVPRVRQRYGLLLASAVLLLVVQGVGPAGAIREIVIAALAGSSLVLALRAASVRPSIVRAAAAAALVVVALAVVKAAGAGIGEGAARLMNAALLAVGPPAVALGIVRDLRASGHVRVEAVSGVLALYMLLGMAFAFAYGAMDQLGGTPFFSRGEEATVSHCLYFSFTTLTTVGYGDFTAATDAGHTLAVLEALLGQIYLVTVVSLIVTNLGRPARGSEREEAATMPAPPNADASRSGRPGSPASRA
jgi:hypothetical protein